MKQKALPAGMAQALGGGDWKNVHIGFTKEEYVLMDNGPHLSALNLYDTVSSN